MHAVSASRRLLSTTFLAVALAAGGAVAPALAQDEAAAVTDGKRVYVDGACHNCHGARGQGGGGVDFPAGPSLRQSQLDRETMTLIISCGVPGTRMPGWLEGAYTTTECYGVPVGASTTGTLVNGIVTAEQIDNLVTYIRRDFMRVED